MAPLSESSITIWEHWQPRGYISVTESDKEATVQEVITQLPERLRANVMRVLEHYGTLSHNQLLATVYAKYPAFATKSRLRRQRSS